MSDLLTIGMATRGEFDSVWFTLTGLTANHPRVRYLVVDNTPERCYRTEGITNASGGTYLHRPDLSGTSKPRDAVFRYATTPWVMCIDSHVILESGAVAAALDYCKANPDSRDLIQGPMVHDDGRNFSTHWNQPKPPGLWGEWMSDPRCLPDASEPFEIPMMGLGLWMMRKESWPGFNPLFGGFGGEEGYTHEVVRRRGGKALCLPALRWRHKFRAGSPPPYPLALEDHVWNLLVGHRELGIEALPQLRESFGNRMGLEKWEQLVAQAEKLQPIGARRETKRQKLLAVWYSDNTAPPQLLDKSAHSIMTAASQTQRHDVKVSACSWSPVSPFGANNTLYKGQHRRGYDTIVAQIRQAVAAQPGEYDAVCFLEHDVLYPANYFDLVGDALAGNPSAPVVSHMNYIGLNATGWQKLRERHEPLHQLTLRWDTFEKNLARAEQEARSGQAVVLEPDHGGERRDWVRTVGSQIMPAVHVNHTNGRLSSHGEVCYEPFGYTLNHPYWGRAENFWPGQMATVANLPTVQQAGGCTSCGGGQQSLPPFEYPTLESWYEAKAKEESDFNEHMPTLRELAAKCESATEISAWLKPADAAMAVGLGDKGRFTSICRSAKPQWSLLEKGLGERFTAMTAEGMGLEIEPTDLLFIDTEHDGEVLHNLLKKHHERVGKYLVVHCTVTYGENSDLPGVNGQPRLGVMHALRRFCRELPAWVVLRHDENNHGLMVLSRCAEDVKELPGLLRKGLNYARAMAKHLAAGQPMVSLEVLEERHNLCAVCPERALDACSVCGCPIADKLVLGAEKCPKDKWLEAPAGKR